MKKIIIDVPDDISIEGQIALMESLDTQLIFWQQLNKFNLKYYWIEKPLSEPVFSENYPVTFEDKGLRDFIQENFQEHFIGITLTDEELDQFKRHLEASLSDWISENWRDFTENRSD